MTSFQDRKNAFENKYANDQEMLFRLESRASKLFGLWAAEQMGLSGSEADAMAAQTVAANLEEAGLEDIKRKVRADFTAKGITVADSAIESAITAAQDEARRQLLGE
ncbi:MAG TPA: DUF1476 domain-containing protein [Alphaproteobacteria bacterium]|nr:DUF1476 domain-containing protein [Rhodospirillaceae bacterium]HRJ12172.1 DUF1476 domain-containing protein [Alphaproteobacteria bacterium]